MKKICLVIFGLIFLAACSSSEHDYYRRKPRANYKFNSRVKPSESMQAGIARKNEVEEPYREGFDNSPLYDYEMAEITRDNPIDGSTYKGYFKIGEPYEIFGVSYFPQNYASFEESGTASWYGDDFHGKLTANGEIYNMDEMTAAHRTLPLPSMVRVTNLRNGKSVIVRVNDRGPFAKNRIIDVSEKAAIALEFKDRGTTEVKIELLRNDTDELLQRLKIKN